MKILFSIGEAPVTLFSVMTCLALLALWAVSLVYLRKEKGLAGAAPLLLLLTGVGALLFSRLVFVLANAAYYIDELNGYWLPALYFWDGGYSMIGYILGVAFGAELTSRLTHVRHAALMNAVGLGLPASVTVLRLGEFIADTAESGDIGEGKYLEGGWVDDLLGRLGLLMQADGDKVYPACLAEMAVTLIIFIALLIWVLRTGSREDMDVLLTFLLLYGAEQIILEQLRDDGHLVFHFVHIQQVLALGLVLLAMGTWTTYGARKHLNPNKLMILWGVVLILIGLAVWACFGVDRWANKLLAWTLLIVPTLLIAAGGLKLRSVVQRAGGD